MANLKDRRIYPKWDCAVINGQVLIKDRKAFDEHLVPLEGKENLELILKPKIKSRSRQIEKYYYAVPLRMIAEAMTITDQEAHELMKRFFLKTEEKVKLPNGKTMRYERVMSTTELGDRRYYDYVFEQVLPWALQPTGPDGLNSGSGLGLYIPLPNEADWDGAEDYQHIIPTE